MYATKSSYDHTLTITKVSKSKHMYLIENEFSQKIVKLHVSSANTILAMVDTKKSNKDISRKANLLLSAIKKEPIFFSLPKEVDLYVNGIYAMLEVATSFTPRERKDKYKEELLSYRDWLLSNVMCHTFS